MSHNFLHMHLFDFPLRFYKNDLNIQLYIDLRINNSTAPHATRAVLGNVYIFIYIYIYIYIFIYILIRTCYIVKYLTG